MLSSFSIAQSGLRASQEQLESIMANLANADNENYVRRVSTLAERQPAGNSTGGGVDLESINRIVDLSLKKTVTDSLGLSGYTAELSSVLGSVESVFNELGVNGLSNSIDEFYTALEEYRANPVANESLFVAKAQNLASMFNSMNTALKDIADQLNTKAVSTVDNVNSIFSQIQDVNAKLIGASNELESNFLLDSRDALEKELSKYIDIQIDNEKPSEASFYKISNNGHVLLSGQSSSGTFSIKQESLLQQDRYLTANGSNALAHMESLTYVHNNNITISISIGDTYDGQIVDSINMLELFAKKINANSELQNQIEAFGGEYEIDNGVKHKIYGSDFLLIESKSDGGFSGFVQGTGYGGAKTIVEKNEALSQVGGQSAVLEYNGLPIELSNSALGVMGDNLNLLSDKNIIQEYATKLSNLASTLVNDTSGYSEDSGVYNYGSKNAFSDSNYQHIGLFDGGDASSIVFREESLSSMSSDDLQYLSKARFYQTNGATVEESLGLIKKQIATQAQEANNNKTNTDALLEVLQSNYDKITRVNKDDEMINLIKIQAGYQANAKTIQVADEMLQTLLQIKR